MVDTNDGMMPNPSGYSAKVLRIFGIALWLLLAFDLGLLTYSVFEIVNGRPDGYHNEHLRSLAGGLSQVSIVGYLILSQRRSFRTISRTAVVCMVAAIAFIAWGFWLAI